MVFSGSMIVGGGGDVPEASEAIVAIDLKFFTRWGPRCVPIWSAVTLIDE